MTLLHARLLAKGLLGIVKAISSVIETRMQAARFRAFNVLGLSHGVIYCLRLNRNSPLLLSLLSDKRWLVPFDFEVSARTGVDRLVFHRPI